MALLIDSLPVVFLGMLVVFAPLAAGSAPPWAVTVAEMLAIVALAAAVFRALCRGELTLLRTWTPVAALAVLVIVLLQMVPLPPAALGQLGGAQYDVYHTTDVGRVPLSLDRFATLVGFAKLVGLFAVFLTFLLAVRGARAVGGLLALVIAVAVTSASLGILQNEVPEEKMFFLYSLSDPGGDWLNPDLDIALSAGYGYVRGHQTRGGVPWAHVIPVPGDIYGTFANSNTFAGFIALVVPLTLALLVLANWRRAKLKRGAASFGFLPEGNLALLLAVSLGIMAVALVETGSRAGLACAFAGILVTVILLALKRFFRPLRLALVLAVILVAGALAVWLNLGGSGAFSFEALRTALGENLATRFDAWRAALAIWDQFPRLGAGLGTYGALAPLYTSGSMVTYFAHNEYLQWLAETGLIGSAALAVFAVTLGWTLLHGLVKSRDDFASATLAGIIGGLVGLGLHCVFDYDMHVLGVAVAATVLAGSGVVVARLTLPAGWKAPPIKRMRRRSLFTPIHCDKWTILRKRWLLALAVAVVCAGGFFYGREALLLRTLQEDVVEMRGTVVGRALDDDPISDRMRNELERTAREVFIADRWAGLASFYLAEVHAYSLALEPGTGDRDYPRGEEGFILKALERAQILRPADGFVRLARVEFENRNRPPAERLAALEAAQRALPDVAFVQYVLGQRCREAGAVEQAREKFALALESSDDFVAPIVAAYVSRHIGSSEKFLAMIPDRPQVLFNVAQRLVNNPDHRQTALTLYRRCREVLDALPPAEQNKYLLRLGASVCEKLGDREAALDYLRRAVRVENRLVERLDIVRLLMDGNRLDEADGELREIRRSMPYNPAVRDMGTRLRRLRE